MTRRAAALAAFLVCAAAPAPVLAQSITTEASVTVGRSTETVNAAAAQLRVFGTITSDWRYFVEGAWGLVTGPASDAFGAAYPYDRRLRPMDAYIEKVVQPRGWLFGVRAGHYRTPFGISGRGDYAYAGFTRAPLIRYGENWALSNTFYETGATFLAGRPSLNLQASVGRPQDEGDSRRRTGVDTVARAQGYFRSLIVGVSYVRTQPTYPATFAKGRMVFGGMDVRWTHRGVQLRGEWISGRPFDHVSTSGGYVDLIVHRPIMGPVSAVARLERLDYEAGPFSSYPRRQTAGARVRLVPSLTAEIDLVRHTGGLATARRVSFDCGLTYTRRF
jgi:hypothetical protein